MTAGLRAGTRWATGDVIRIPHVCVCPGPGSSCAAFRRRRRSAAPGRGPSIPAMAPRVQLLRTTEAGRAGPRPVDRRELRGCIDCAHAQEMNARIAVRAQPVWSTPGGGRPIGLRRLGRVTRLALIGEKGVDHDEAAAEHNRSDRDGQPCSAHCGRGRQHHGRPRRHGGRKGHRGALPRLIRIGEEREDLESWLVQEPSTREPREQDGRTLGRVRCQAGEGNTGSPDHSSRSHLHRRTSASIVSCQAAPGNDHPAHRHIRAPSSGRSGCRSARYLRCSGCPATSSPVVIRRALHCGLNGPGGGVGRSC